MSDNEERNLELVKLSFDGNKHLTTLAVAVLILIRALNVDTNLALILFGGTLLLSLIGMTNSLVTTSTGHPSGSYHGMRFGVLAFLLSSTLFMLGITFLLIRPAI